MVHTRPDISFVIRKVSRFIEAATIEHLSAVKNLLMYVAGTLDYGCYYTTTTGDARFIGYSDADMAGDVDSHKIHRARCSSGISQHKVVSLSYCESEYIATTTAACQGIWLGRLLGDLLGTDPLVADLLMDNKSAIQLCKHLVFHDRSKHIEVRYNYIRGCIEDDTITIKFLGADDQLADIFTKALGCARLQLRRERINVGEVK